jgi:hypothetical protein
MKNEPPQIINIKKFSDFVHIAFTFDGADVEAFEAVVAAYNPRRALVTATERISARISLAALGDAWIGDYVGEAVDRRVYYQRKQQP